MYVYMYIIVVCEYTYNYVMQVCFIWEVMCVERERETEREKERCSILFTSLFTALSFFLSFLFFLPKTGDFLEAANRSRGEKQSQVKTLCTNQMKPQSQIKRT